jgi:hypothetical protein
MPWLNVHRVSARIVVCIQPPGMRTGIRRNTDVGPVCSLKFPTKIFDTLYPRAELPDTGAYDDSIAGRNSGLIGGDGDAARICHHHTH